MHEMLYTCTIYMYDIQMDDSMSSSEAARTMTKKLQETEVCVCVCVPYFSLEHY